MVSKLERNLRPSQLLSRGWRRLAIAEHSSPSLERKKRMIATCRSTFPFSSSSRVWYVFNLPSLVTIFNSTNLLSSRYISLISFLCLREQNQSTMSRLMGLFDLEKHFAFYGAYHSNPINIIIHIIFVWPIVFTALLLLHSTTPIFDPSQLGFSQSLTLDGVLRFNLGFIFTVIYALFYIGLDKKSGFVAALMCFSCWVGASFLAARLGPSLAFKVGIASQLLCWTGQFVGHGVFEKRAPALLDNLVQAFLMAPFFVLLEVLQSIFGYEPYPGFQARVNAKVESDIKEWRAKKQKKNKIT